jgi:hypothetical protein
MKLELRAVKTVKALSEETQCFSATVYADGRLAGTVSNRGHGGSHEYHWSDRVLGRQIEEWAALQPTEFQFEKLDQQIDRLLDAIEAAKWVARNTKKNVLFRLRGEKKGAWRTIKGTLTTAIKDFLTKKYGEQLECIANENPALAATL